VESLAEIIVKRANIGKNYGVVIIPEGLIEFFPDVNVLIGEINDIFHDGDQEFTEEQVLEKLSEISQEVFNFLPKSIRE